MPYPETAFGGFTRHSPTIAFYSRVNALLQPDFVVLDVGCGTGKWWQNGNPYVARLRSFKGRCQAAWGCDVDREAATNTAIEQYYSITEQGWGAPDASVDLAFADCVLEHVPNPQQFFAEAARVVKPGGTFCVRTPNRLGYVALGASLVPNRLHDRVLARLQPHRKSADVFPTVYRCNTAGKLRRAFDAAGFDSAVYSHESEPAYFGRGLAYRVMSLTVPLVPPLFRNVLMAFGRKR